MADDQYSRIKKQLSLTHAVEGVSPRAKDSAIVSDIRNLYKFLRVPAVNANDYLYPCQLLFQFNVTLEEDFYFLNIENYRAFTQFIISGGCLCVKYRIGTNVFRYKLFDHNSSVEWNYFEDYHNQKIHKNFCIEFYGNAALPEELLNPRGLLQEIILQRSIFYQPISFPQDPQIDNVIAGSVLNIADLTFGALPQALPYNQPNIVYITN